MLWTLALVGASLAVWQDSDAIDLALCAAEERFDFLLGEWNVYVDDELSSTATAERELRETAIRYTESSVSGGYAAVAMLNLDIEGRWTQSWADTSRFQLFYHGGLVEGRMELVQTEPYFESLVGSLVHPRQVFQAIHRNRFVWRWDISLDAGQSWRNQDERIFRRRGAVFEDHHPIFGPNHELIAFDSTREGNADLFVMRPDGTGVRRVTSGTSEDKVPCFSPDGRWLAFQSRRDGETDVWIVGVDGKGLRRLTHQNLGGSRPAWSPDGERIAITHWLDVDSPRLLVVEVDGGDLRLLVDGGRVPAWSPDGKRIAYSANRFGNEDLYVMDADGGDELRVTTDPALDSVPSWSADGEWIVFQARVHGNADVFLVRPDGTDRFQITATPHDEAMPTFGPRDAGILFQGNVNGVPEIFSVGLDPEAGAVRRLSFAADGSR